MPDYVDQVFGFVVWRGGHAEQCQRALTGDVNLLGVIAGLDEDCVRVVVVGNAEDRLLDALVASVGPDEQRVLGTAF